MILTRTSSVLHLNRAVVVEKWPKMKRWAGAKNISELVGLGRAGGAWLGHDYCKNCVELSDTTPELPEMTRIN